MRKNLGKNIITKALQIYYKNITNSIDFFVKI